MIYTCQEIFQVNLKPPVEYTQKKDTSLPEVKKFTYPDAASARPAVPKHNEKPVMGMKTQKNFITSNAVENINSLPKVCIFLV